MPQLDTASFWEIAIFTFCVYFTVYVLFDVYSRNTNFWEKFLSYKKIVIYAIYEKTTVITRQLGTFSWTIHQKVVQRSIGRNVNSLFYMGTTSALVNPQTKKTSFNEEIAAFVEIGLGITAIGYLTVYSIWKWWLKPVPEAFPGASGGPEENIANIRPPREENSLFDIPCLCPQIDCFNPALVENLTRLGNPLNYLHIFKNWSTINYSAVTTSRFYIVPRISAGLLNHSELLSRL